jgi:hypothetical protein
MRCWMTEQAQARAKAVRENDARNADSALRNPAMGGLAGSGIDDGDGTRLNHRRIDDHRRTTRRKGA